MNNNQPEPAPTEPASAEQVLLLPGCLFFIETIEILDELDATDVSDFAELSLESIAPFPIEQLNWGYLYHEGTPTLLIYAAQRERLKKQGYSELTNYTWVLPDFATLSGVQFNEDTLVALKGDNSVSLLYFEKNAAIPKSAWVDTIEDVSAEDVIQTLESSIRNIPKTVPTLQLDRPAVTSVNEKSLPTFAHTAANPSTDRRYDGIWQTITPTETQLWQSDVRSADFKTAERSKRRTSALILRTLSWAALFALVLLSVEGILLVSQSWLQKKLAHIKSQQDAVSKVEEKQTLVNRLEQVAQNELRPIEILEAANDIRLKMKLGIEYDSVIVEGENHITIEGKADSVNAYNSYTQGLRNSGLFELLDAPTPRTQAGKPTFRISLAYISAPTEPEPASPETTEGAKS